ncbi:hypothetical protein CERSUDRAFT_93427 [Gelatoporia subvermispora B]|uniref:Uncharacterized protein n=1 Tax=Ceriporiopsis subvermispora (strain B) TaxID=914234 RepID=M2R4C5_CERS8|nr:hypothetical protein CERSUDRAFT_93427 [Gelatoporia subvermispora B]
MDANRAGVKAPLATVVLRDGLAYFVILLGLNLLTLAGWITQDLNYFSTIMSPLTSITISRFLMNLRQADCTRSGSELDCPSFVRAQLSSVRFASFVGNFGEPLDNEENTIWLSEDIDECHGSQDLAFDPTPLASVGEGRAEDPEKAITRADDSTTCADVQTCDIS